VPIRRLWSRVEPLSDPVIALALIVFGSWDILAHNPGSYPGSAGGHEVFLVLCCAPLAWRRRAPLAVLMVVFGVTLAWVYSMYRLDQQGPFEGFVAIMIAVYTAAAYTSGNEAIATAVVTTVGLLVGVITGGVGGESAGNVIPFTLWVVVGGANWWQRNSATASPDSSGSVSSGPNRLWRRSVNGSRANCTT
jgi:hypothetical protein